jgi:hypothetical protein
MDMDLPCIPHDGPSKRTTYTQAFLGRSSEIEAMDLEGHDRSLDVL